MPAENSSLTPPSSNECQLHHQPANWHCGLCNQPLCPACKPIGYNYLVYHEVCLTQVQKEQDRTARQQQEPDAPSWGLRALAWIFIVSGIVAFGLFLLLLGLDLFGRFIPIRAFLGGSVPSSLDTIPGGRTMLMWLSLVCAIAGVGLTLLGIGLLNCVAGVRIVVLFLAWLEVALGIIGWLGVWIEGEGFWDVPILGLLLIGYFSRKSVKRQFQKVL